MSTGPSWMARCPYSLCLLLCVLVEDVVSPLHVIPGEAQEVHSFAEGENQFPLSWHCCNSSSMGEPDGAALSS